MRFSVSKLSLSDICAGWVHPSIQSGTRDYAAHLGFIKLSLVMGTATLVLFPLLLAFGGGLTLVGWALFAMAGLPLIIAYFVSRTGMLARGKLAALVGSATFIVLCALGAGGASWLIAAMLCVLPIEASLWRFGRPILLGGSLAVVGGSIVSAANTQPAFGFGAAVIAPSDGLWFAAAALLYAVFVSWRVHNNRIEEQVCLAQERARFQMMVQNSNELITRHDRNGRTLFASPAARSLFGVGPRELLNSGLLDRVHLQDRIIFLKSVSDAERLGKEQTCRLRIRFKGDGTRLWKWVETVCRPAKDEPSGQLEIICASADISEIVELQEAMRDVDVAVEEQTQAQKRFLATMSHELRTPLNAIIGFSDILQEELFGKLPYDRHREYVGLIQDSGQHLLNVVNDMLDMSRIEAGRYELTASTFPLVAIATATVDMLQPIASKASVNVACDIDPELPELTADRRACQQILINLLSNAIKFTPEHGRVRLSAKQHGRFLKIRVKDNGIGIAPDFLPRIGQPFAQAETGNSRKFEGSGLGVSVVKGLIDLHRGEFQIQSRPGEGTLVTVTLPIKSSLSKPVPSDADDQLVHLEKQQTQTNTSNEGDRRARVSA